MANGRLGLRTRPGLIRSYTEITSGDADANAFISAVGLTDATQKNAINQLVLDLKDYNIWSKMKAIYPFVGGTADTHKWNLKDARDLDAAYRLVFSGGWTHSSTGAKPNGTNAFANTYLGLTILTQTHCHLSYYSRTTTDVSGYPTAIGAYGNSSYQQAAELYLRRPADNNNGGGQIGSYLTSIIGFSESTAARFAIISRTSATSLKYYSANILRATNTISDTTGFVNHNIYIGAANYIGTASNFSTLECAFASIGDGLNDNEAADLYTAVQAFQTTLGRQI